MNSQFATRHWRGIAISALAATPLLFLAIVALIARSHHRSFPIGTDSSSAPLLLAAVTTWATVVLTVVAGWTLDENRRVIRASEEQARASREQAEAANQMIHEIQRDRELGFAPYLVMRDIAAPLAENPHTKHVIQNIGRGPALHCHWAYYVAGPNTSTVGLWGSYPAGAIGVGDIRAVMKVPEIDEPWHKTILGDGSVRDPETEAAICEDQFGYRYRFVSWRARREVWRPGEEPRPYWSYWPDDVP